MKHKAAEQRGRRAESIAAWWLRFHGWRILAQRARCRAGEVDLVARRGRLVAFVEVKSRNTRAELDFAVDAVRLRRVAAAANAMASRYARSGDDIRIDVMLIAPCTLPRHIINVWHG